MTKEKSSLPLASDLVPSQQVGSETGAKHEVFASSRVKALELFRTAKRKLLHINHWHNISGPGSATFKLLNDQGVPVFRDPVIGDLICMDLPGPGPAAGDGYDWVRIEAMDDHTNPIAETESFAFRTRPVKKPYSEGNDIAHFYTSDATSTFVIERNGDLLMAQEVGKNEISNTKTSKVTDKIRNSLLATGARVGFSALQWKGLMKGLLEPGE